MAKIPVNPERGKRLQELRNNMGMPRPDFAKYVQINEHTLKSYENGSRNIPVKFARKISRIAIYWGMDVSFETLYYGQEAGILDFKTVMSDDLNNINEEIMFFKDNNPHSIIFKVRDTLMSPIFNMGDMVGGQKVTDTEQFPLFIDHICIIQTVTNSQYLRKIIKVDQQKVTASTLAADKETNQPVIEEIEAFSLAQATRHWHISELILPPEGYVREDKQTPLQLEVKEIEPA